MGRNVASGLALVAAACASTGGGGDRCADAVAAGRAGAGWICLARFRVDRDVGSGVRAARALADDGQSAAPIAAIADAIGDRAGGAEAWNALGDARRMSDDDDGAIAAYARALAHRDPADRAGRIHDEVGLYNRYGHRNQFGPAMHYAALAYQQARQLGAPFERAYVLTGVATLLFDMGDLPVAERLAAEADTVIVRDDVFEPYLLQLHGLIDSARGRYRVAETELAAAVAAARRLRGLDNVVLDATLSGAWAQVQAGELDLAERTLAAAPATPPGSESRAIVADIASRIALERGQLDRAIAIAGAAVVDAPADWAAILDGARGRALARAGRDDEAERALAHAIARTEDTRAEIALDALKPWVVEVQREPFEDLFRLLVAHGRAGEALEVVQRATARSLLDGLLRQDAPPAMAMPDDLDRAGERVQGLRALARTVRASASVAVPSAAQLADRLGDRPVATYFHAGDELWLVTAASGEVRAFRIGAITELRELVSAWLAAPDRIELADQLGARLVPAAALPPPGVTWYVATDEPVRDVAFAALRVGGAYLVERNPIAYVPSASVLAAIVARPAGGSGALVIGDPTGDLPGARREAEEVARVLGVAPRLGPAARRQEVLGGPDRALVHVAAHAELTATGAALRLADGALGAGEVIDRGGAARVVVLSSCSSADPRDRDELGPLASAFLAAGATAVVASRWAVPDDDALRFARAFYAAGGDRDAPRGVAIAQRALIAAGVPSSAWATFVAIGASASPDRPKEDHR